MFTRENIECRPINRHENVHYDESCRKLSDSTSSLSYLPWLKILHTDHQTAESTAATADKSESEIALSQSVYDHEAIIRYLWCD